jgi:hypothetical protein
MSLAIFSSRIIKNLNCYKKSEYKIKENLKIFILLDIMTKIDALEVSRIIEKVGEETNMPPRSIDKAISWAVRSYPGLEIEAVSKRMENVFLRKYNDAMNRVFSSDPQLKDFIKRQGPSIEEAIATKIAYGALAAVAYQNTDWRTYGKHVRTFEQEASLFGMPGSSAEFLDEVDAFLERKE